MRFAFHAGGHILTGNNNNRFFFSGAYMNQAGATDEILGVAYGINLGDFESSDYMINVGGWYRIKESIIPYVGIDWGNMKWGLTYDIINSDLKNVSSKTGSFELSFILMMNKAKNYYSNYKRGRF